MIINQEALKKMNEESITYKPLCCKLCSRRRKIFVDKVNLTKLLFQIWRNGTPT